MIAAILIAAAVPTAIDAERAFAADAHSTGQWTAFRKWAAEEALMFLPQPVKAHDALKDRKDPPVSIFWWPGRSFVSCDGDLAVNTGPWVRGWGKSVGYFTSVWRREGDSWHWLYDAGDELPKPRAEGGDIRQVTASCDGRPKGASVLGSVAATGHQSGAGQSPDGTLSWSWTVSPKGERHFIAQLWDGRQFNTVIEDRASD